MIRELPYPHKDGKALPPEVLKLGKSLPVQVSEATVKPPQSLLFYCVLSAASHHKESFLAPAASLAASAQAAAGQQNLYGPSFSRPVSSTHLTVSNECNVLAGEQNFSW